MSLACNQFSFQEIRDVIARIDRVPPEYAEQKDPMQFVTTNNGEKEYRLCTD